MTMAREAAHPRRQSLAAEYPLLFAFGPGPIAPLSHAAAIVATPQERIRSVWPFLVKVVLRFADTLPPHARSNYDPEDVLTALYLALLERDAKWEPARGRYLTFIAKVVANELHAIRDQAHTVHSPRNSSCRLKQYAAAAAAGNLSARKAKTYHDIRRVLAGTERLSPEASRGGAGANSAPGAAEEAARREQLRLVHAAVRAGVMALTVDEAATIGGAYGLWGQPDESLATLAFQRRMTLDELKKTKGHAHAKIRARLLELTKRPPKGTGRSLAPRHSLVQAS